jgi:hypothetical protein
MAIIHDIPTFSDAHFYLRHMHRQLSKRLYLSVAPFQIHPFPGIHVFCVRKTC